MQQIIDRINEITTDSPSKDNRLIKALELLESKINKLQSQTSNDALNNLNTENSKLKQTIQKLEFDLESKEHQYNTIKKTTTEVLDEINDYINELQQIKSAYANLANNRK